MVTEPAGLFELIVAELDRLAVLMRTFPPTAATDPPDDTLIEEPAPWFVSVISPALEVTAPKFNRLPAGFTAMLTLVPEAFTLPDNAPLTVTVVGCPDLLKLTVPVVPVPEAAETVPAMLTFNVPAALLVMFTVPPAPAFGAVAVTLPLTPLFAGDDPTTNVLPAGSLYVMSMTPPAPVPTPLADKLPVTLKAPAVAVPDFKVMLAPVPFVPRGPALIAWESMVSARPACTVTVPPLPVGEFAKIWTDPLALPRVISPVVPVAFRVTVPPLLAPVAFALRVSEPPVAATLVPCTRIVPPTAPVVLLEAAFNVVAVMVSAPAALIVILPPLPPPATVASTEMVPGVGILMVPVLSKLMVPALPADVVDFKIPLLTNVPLLILAVRLPALLATVTKGLTVSVELLTVKLAAPPLRMSVPVPAPLALEMVNC
jgi:hypothetical protein